MTSTENYQNNYVVNHKRTQKETKSIENKFSSFSNISYYFFVFLLCPFVVQKLSVLNKKQKNGKTN